MKEISLHILDILQNSIVAGATLVELIIDEQPDKDFLKFEITDNGCGMDEEFLKAVTNPYTTKRTTRRVGLGIPLLKLAAESTGGGIDIWSEVGKGTKISANFGYHHIDRQPLGNMAETVNQLITSYEDVDFVYRHTVGEKSFLFDTREIKEILNGVSFNIPEVSLWILEYLNEKETEVYK